MLWMFDDVVMLGEVEGYVQVMQASSLGIISTGKFVVKEWVQDI